MLRQTLRNRQPDALRGIGIVLGAAAALLMGSVVFTRLESRLGPLSSALFIAYGCAVAWFLLNWYVMAFVYTASADCLRVCRAYGKRERFVADVWFSQLLACGDEADMKRRYPGARVTRATRAQCPLPPLALAYRENGKPAIIVLQPEEEIRARIVGALKGSREKGAGSRE